MTAQKEKELVKLTISGLFETFCKDIISTCLHTFASGTRQSRSVALKRHVFVFFQQEANTMKKVQKADKYEYDAS